MVDVATGGSGLPWPEEYASLLPAIRSDWGVDGDIYLLRRLSAGKSGALVYTVDITAKGFAGQAILKLDQAPDPKWNEHNETERHRRAFVAAPDFAERHLPHLVHSLVQGDQIASLLTITAGGLEYVAAWFDCPHERQVSVGRRLTRSILEDWNRDYTIATGMTPPADLLRKWLGYRIDPSDGRIFPFVTEACGLAADEPSFVFEGQWYPNPLVFAAGLRDVPGHLNLRAAVGSQHGDFHGDNLLVAGTSDGEVQYYVIDLAMYETDQFLFFDHAYLELSYLLRAREEQDWARWDSLLQCLVQPADRRDKSALQRDDVGLVDVASTLREGIPEWIARHEGNRVSHMDSQCRLARVGAGLSFSNKLMPAVSRRKAFIYAASNLKDYLAFHGADWPRHGPPLRLGDDDEEKAAGSAVWSAPSTIPTAAPSPSPRTPPSAAGRPVKRYWAVAAVAALLIAGMAGVWSWWQADQRGKSTGTSQESGPSAVIQTDRSIVVLPFDSLSPGEEYDMLAAGVTSTVSAALAQVPELEVISRRSAQHYKGTSLTSRQIAKELDVRYVLDGSLQRSGEQVRITTELIDGETGRVVWSDKFRRKASDLLAVEDEIALKVMVLLQVKLVDGQQAAVQGEATQNLEAYLLFLRAQQEYRRYTRRGMQAVRRLAEQIQALDRNFAPAYVLEANSYIVDARLGYADAKTSLNAASRVFKEVAELDGKISPVEEGVILAAEAALEQLKGNFEKAIAIGDKALAMASSNSDILSTLGIVFYFSGEFDRSIDLFRRAIRLRPSYPGWYTLFLSRAYAFKGNTADAIKWAEDGKARGESDLLKALSAANLVFAYYEAGRHEDAKREAAEVKRFMPSLTLKTLLAHQRYRNAKDREKLAEALKQSGLS